MKKLLLALVFLNGCASQGVDRADQDVITKSFYASIESVKEIKLSSNVKTGIATGAAIGFVDELDGNHEDMIAGSIGGALVGGLFMAIFEGSNKAYEYKLYSESEGEFTLIQKKLIDIDSGCGNIRVSGKTSISAASKGNCH